MSGKGDTPRPVNKSKFDENYDRIFGSKKGATEPFADEPVIEEKYFWVDPPTGYIWGFPKIVKLPVKDGELHVFDIDKILSDLGYPETQIKQGASAYCRFWPATDDDIQFNVVNALTNHRRTH